MNEIIKIEEVNGCQFVNARDLHQTLEVGRDFSTWVKERVAKYGFVDGVDYTTSRVMSSPVSGSAKARPQETVEYNLSVATAKELAMVENNEKGRNVRQYLIKVESAWNTPEMIMARALQMSNRALEGFKNRAFEAEARVSRLVHNQTTYTSTEMAKELGMKSAQELHETLRAKGIIFKDARGLWLLYSEYSGRGFQNIKQREINGSPRYYAEWTGVGRDWLVGLFANK